MDGQQAWQLPPLQGVQKLSDFAAILILTDNADSGRAWIEQTGSAIGNTPLLMVISAQAEPMLLPYYDSGQIKGLVTGLAGGEAYAQAYIRPDGTNWSGAALLGLIQCWDTGRRNIDRAGRFVERHFRLALSPYQGWRRGMTMPVLSFQCD